MGAVLDLAEGYVLAWVGIFEFAADAVAYDEGRFRYQAQLHLLVSEEIQLGGQRLAMPWQEGKTARRIGHLEVCLWAGGVQLDAVIGFLSTSCKFLAVAQLW